MITQLSLSFLLPSGIPRCCTAILGDGGPASSVEPDPSLDSRGEAQDEERSIEFILLRLTRLGYFVEPDQVDICPQITLALLRFAQDGTTAQFACSCSARMAGEPGNSSGSGHRSAQARGCGAHRRRCLCRFIRPPIRFARRLTSAVPQDLP